MTEEFKTVGLLAALSALLIAASYWLLGGWSGALFGIVLAAVTNLGAWYYSDRIALAAYRAQPVSDRDAPGLHQMVTRLSQRAGLPKPAVYIVPTAAPNAFATGRDPQHAAVAVTQGLLEMLPADELEGVLAHELSHVANRDTLTQAVAATIAGAISFLANIAWWFGSADDDGPNPLALFLMMLFAPIAAAVIQMGISRTREFAADAGAAELTGNPQALARALRRLEAGSRRMRMQANPAFEPLLITNNLSGRLLSGLFSTHPPTDARVQRLLAMTNRLP
ncbi:MAG: zinc metalloprotease HtpX [Spirulinaceae cyanobacterium SM2_1_0]|nr:zinc metalloprotease HtpX [Spirulinaceae cyanobacterium SM2_1_0]